MTRFRLSPSTHFRRRAIVLVAWLSIAAALTTACTAGSPRGELGQDQQILSTCDPAAPPASMVQIDGTGSSLSKAIAAERMVAVESIVRRTAICSGHLKVLVFSASSAATTAIFDGPLSLEGATANARLKRVPALVGDVMGEIKKEYVQAIKQLAPGGSDITAQLRLASEWIGQLDDSFKLHLYVLTDGFQNVGVDLSTRVLSETETKALVDKQSVPDLAEAAVVVAGLGRVAGDPPPSAVVEGLVIFYEELCRKTGATDCVAVTDYTAGW